MTAPDRALTETQIADVLAGHRNVAYGHCRCGEQMPQLGDYHRQGEFSAWLRRHIAAVLYAEVVQQATANAAAEAWDEGWLTGNRWAFTELDADAIEANPYRHPAHEPE